MRICIVTPGQLGSNPRVVKEADALAAAGHDVTVICSKVSNFVEPRDQAVMRQARFAVHRLEFDRPAHWRLARLRQEAARVVYPMGGERSARFAISAMTPALMRAALEHRADLYIAHYPPALPAAARAAQRFGASYAFDAEDFHLGDLPDKPEHEFDRALIRVIEGTYLPKAAYVTAASPLISDAYAQSYGIDRPTTILNVFPRIQAPAAATESGSAVPGPSLYWFSQVIGPGRGLEDAVKAIAATQSQMHLYLRGTPARGFVEHLQVLASSLGVQDRLHVLEPVEPALLERDGSRFDIGYAGDLAETRNRQIALTNKLFSYLSSGLPVVATDILAHRLLSERLGAASVLFPLGVPAALARALDALLCDKSKLAAARRHAWKLGQTVFSWESQIEALIELVGGRVTAASN